MKKLLFSFLLVAGFAMNAQTVLFEDDFESYTIDAPNTGDGTQIPDGYTSYDVNGDAYNWGLSNPMDWTQPMGDIYSGNFMISVSYHTGPNVPVEADNIMVLPMISIPADATDVTLSFYAGSGTDTGFYAETYDVIVTTENTEAAILAATPVYTETLSFQGGETKTVNLDDFAGQDIYISFYHRDTFDQWVLGIDDISVTMAGGGGGPTYCDLVDLDCAIEKINSVTFAGIENLDTGCGTAAENDFTDMVANVSVGETYEMIVDLDADPAFPDDNAFFFIDWNQNGTLDDAGEVYELVMHTGTSGVYTVDVTVPADATEGETRLRVGIAYNSGVDYVPQPCPGDDGTLYGEYEDYTVVVGDGGPVDTNCDEQEVPSNNLENGLFFGGDTDQLLAVDVAVGDTGYPVYGVDLNVFTDGNTDLSFTVTFYEDDAGLPGTVHAITTASVISSEFIGNAFGFDVYNYVTAFATPVDLDANTTYWMQVESDGLAWEATSATLLGSGLAFSNTNTGGVWTNDPATELVYNLICEELGVSNMNSFDFAYYPNPVKDILYIDAKKSISNVTVNNLTGQQVMNKVNINNGQIDVTSLNAGVYVFRVTLEGGQVETFKIIKK